MPGKITIGSGSRHKVLSRGLDRRRGSMNKTEARYADQLEAWIQSGEVVQWWFEPMTLRISHPESGQPARVSIDFMVLLPDGVTCMDDVKGGGPVDNASIVRMKAAAELYPLWVFRIVTHQKGGGWKTQTV